MPDAFVVTDKLEILEVKPVAIHLSGNGCLDSANSGANADAIASKLTPVDRLEERDVLD